MDKFKYIGHGERKNSGWPNWPFHVMVCFDSPERPIGLSEGIDHASGGGNFRLQDILDSRWDEHLDACDCLWLRELAHKEKSNQTNFSPNEIFEIWKNL